VGTFLRSVPEACGAVFVLPDEATGLGFRRMGPRILEAARASEIGGGDGYRRSIKILRLGLKVGNTGLRSPM
jgi:hypothetical protein